MALSAQDKILYVANKLGLATLKDMQGSTGAVYDSDVNGNGLLFAAAAQHTFPSETNLNDNRFEVNEALLVETIGFVAQSVPESAFEGAKINPLWEVIGQDAVIVFDLIIGNKRVLKDTPIFAAGNPSTFASTGQYSKIITSAQGGFVEVYHPRTQIFLEGAGILIPPQVEFQLSYKIYNMTNGAIIPAPEDYVLQAYLYGTKVNLNFNTSI
jgi:hypothetical protein